MHEFRCRRAAESDRPFLYWMDEVAELMGDESKDLPPDYAETRERYVGRWTPEQGGVVLEMTGPDGAALDAADPEVAELLGASSRGAAFPVAGGALPAGAAWLRVADGDDAGRGWFSPEYPEVAVALRPGLLGRGLSRPLMDGVLAAARDIGYPGVSLSVKDVNVRGVKAYLRAGFEVVDRVDDPLHGSYAVMLHRFGAGE
ncbi:GNAT family N-acetyltransferase [Corynebacterium sp. 335C]